MSMKADKQAVSLLLRTARGQIDAALKMIEEDRYCVEISNQLLATEALIRKADMEVLSAHMKSCVKNAQTEEEKDQKIEEMVQVLTRLSR